MTNSSGQMSPDTVVAEIMARYERGELTPRGALYAILTVRFNQLFPWPLPDDPFDMGPWFDVLTPEQRNALEAIRSR